MNRAESSSFAVRVSASVKGFPSDAYKQGWIGGIQPVRCRDLKSAFVPPEPFAMEPNENN
jgi:hypothetical protein